jgi:hypothetical protein
VTLSDEPAAKRWVTVIVPAAASVRDAQVIGTRT